MPDASSFVLRTPDGTPVHVTTWLPQGPPRAVVLIAHGMVEHAARYDHLTGRDRNQLASGQARAAVAGSLLRQLHAVVTRRQPWNPKIAAGHRAAEGVIPQAA